MSSVLPPSRGATPLVIRRQLAVSFGLVAAIAAVASALLLGCLQEVSSLVAEMRRNEALVRRGFELSAAVREQYIHIGHTLIEGDESHLAHYDTWYEKASSDETELTADASPEVAASLRVVREITRDVDRLFHEEVFTGARTGHIASMRRSHRELDALVQQASAAADAVATIGEAQMADAHQRAESVTRWGFISGVLGVSTVMLVGAIYTVRLQQAVLQPLGSLTRAARQFGRGNFRHRVGGIGNGEMEVLAQAFDRMADELAAREQLLLIRERMAAIGELASGVAHEINNPIGIIRGYIKTMLPEAPTSRIAEELRILDEEAAACQRLTEDLLGYANARELRQTTVDMRAFLLDSVARLSELLGPSTRPLLVNAEPGEAHIDRNRMRQVLANLVRNAAQASPALAPIRISGSSSPTGGYSFSVADEGPGIPSKDSPKVFEPFFSRRAGGSGLGLAIASNVVSAHGGTIEIRQNIPRGAVFVVDLPEATSCGPQVGGTP